MVIVMLITMVETTGDVFACGDIVEKPVDKDRRGPGAAGRRPGHDARRHPQLVPLHLLRRERRAGPADQGQEPVRGGHRRPVHDDHRPRPQGRGDRRRHPAAGARRGRRSRCSAPWPWSAIQTLRRVDFHDERNVIILAVSLGLAIAPTVYPTIISELPRGVRTIISSGITLGSITAILLNLIFNVWGGHEQPGDQGAADPAARRGASASTRSTRWTATSSSTTFGGLFQGPPWIAEQAVRRPPVRGRVRPAQGLPRRPVRGAGRSSSSSSSSRTRTWAGCATARAPAVGLSVDGPGVRRPRPARQRRVPQPSTTSPGPTRRSSASR